MKGWCYLLKIDIIGSVASGKTTLARQISRRVNVPYYEKDNIVWKRTSDGDVKEARRNGQHTLRNFYRTAFIMLNKTQYNRILGAALYV